MLLMWLIQACTDCRKGAGQLCEILKRRHRSHLPDIYRALLHTGQRDVAELLGFKGLSGVWTIRCHTSSNFLACLRTYSAIHLLPQLIRPKTFLFMPVNVCCMSHRANKFGMLFTILVITLFIFNTLPFLFKFLMFRELWKQKLSHTDNVDPQGIRPPNMDTIPIWRHEKWSPNTRVTCNSSIADTCSSYSDCFV